jgi:hypothetical protein
MQGKGFEFTFTSKKRCVSHVKSKKSHGVGFEPQITGIIIIDNFFIFFLKKFDGISLSPRL